MVLFLKADLTYALTIRKYIVKISHHEIVDFSLSLKANQHNMNLPSLVRLKLSFENELTLHLLTAASYHKSIIIQISRYLMY